MQVREELGVQVRIPQCYVIRFVSLFAQGSCAGSQGPRGDEVSRLGLLCLGVPGVGPVRRPFSLFSVSALVPQVPFRVARRGGEGGTKP